MLEVKNTFKGFFYKIYYYLVWKNINETTYNRFIT